jgi:hypothetical protein
MPLKTRLFLVGLLPLLGTVVVLVWFSPVAVSNGLRLWVWWRGRQEGLMVSIDRIDAPFLRPVAIRSLHIKNVRADAFHIDLTATDTKFDLNFTRLLLHRRGYVIRNLSIQDLHGEIRRDNPNVQGITKYGWRTLQRLLPQKFSLASSQIRVQDGPTLILLRDGVISASDIEAGRFSAGEVMIASPWLRQTFSQLHGATRWDADRLTLAGLTLARGLDLESISTDLSRLGSQRIGLEFDADAFGGKIRGNISHEWNSPRYNWKIAGVATDLSLAQTSEAIGLTDHFDGLLRACNFTFRGNLNAPAQVTASLWTEMTSFTWRNRTAEAIMFGASLYNQQIQLQQLYIKQKANQLTLSGQASFSSKSSEWLSPDFRGDISATINNLGDFTGLFGATSGDFAGKLMIQGTLNTRAHKLAGDLRVEGASLTLFKTAIDTLSAKLKLEGTQLAIEQFDLTRKNDSLNAQGTIDMAHAHSYSGTLRVTAENLTDYLSIFRGPEESNSKPLPVNIQAAIDSTKWDARAIIGLPGSSTLNFEANFLLPIGTNWNAFFASPINATLEFPSIFLANAPQFFHPEIFRDGILSGSLSFSQTLQHPWITGDVQLVNGKLQNCPLNIGEANGRIAFTGQSASIDFLNADTTDVALSARGEVSLHDIDHLVIKISFVTPVFDLTLHPINCVRKIEIAPVPATLTPTIPELEVRGGLFQSNWTLTFRERTSAPASANATTDEIVRAFPLCLDGTVHENTFSLGAPPRPEGHQEPIFTKKRPKRR